VNCREKEPILKFRNDAGFICDSCHSKENNNKAITYLGHWSTNKQDKNKVCMHISHATDLVAHHQPLTMEAWGHAYLKALLLSLVHTFPQKMGPSEAAVSLRHGLT